MSQQSNPYVHLTVKERDHPPFLTRKLLGLGCIRARVLDFGCGHGDDVDFLREKGGEVADYDPVGFNIGLNDGDVAGQSVGHAHLHVLPRYKENGRDAAGMQTMWT